MKILITGGAGYIGANIAASLLANSDVEKVIVYDNFSRKNYNVLSLMHESQCEKLLVVNGELLDGATLLPLIEEVDTIIHLAAMSRTPFNDDNPHHFDQVNHWGTANIISLIERQNNKKKFIYASSGSVYGRTDEPVNITTVPHPSTSYASSKFSGENQCLRLEKKHDVSIVRFGNVYGIGKATRFDSVINKFFLDALFNKPLLVEGSGTQIRPFIYLDDAIKVLEYFVFNHDEAKVHNVNTHNWTVNDVVNGYKEINSSIEVIYVNRNEQLRDLQLQPSYVIDKLLSDSLTHNFDAFLVDMYKKFNEANANL